MCKKEYKIFAALKEDISSGHIWMTKGSGCQSGKRQIAKITNPDNGHTIYCECLQIDSNFETNYNSSSNRITIDSNKEDIIVLNKWYRNKLGVETQKSYFLEIKFSNCLLWGCNVAMHHPQIIVRQAFWLGAIGVILGLISLIYPFLRETNANFCPIFFIVIVFLLHILYFRKCFNC